MSYKLQVLSSKLIIGFITYGESSFKYLPFFLDSLKNQSFKEFSVIAFDNSQEYNLNADYLIDKHPEIRLIRSEENIGYARAYNRMIRIASEAGAKYFLALNPDIILEPDAIERLFEKMEKNANLASVSPKILKWDFKNKKKAKTIDSLGIAMKPGLRFFDVGQGSMGEEKADEILGPSGAAAFYRMSSLDKVKRNDQYFDDLMFMYKEDCDLAYRLFLAGFKSECVNDSIVYHDRTALSSGEGDLASILARRGKGRRVKEWSFLNQHIVFLKYWNIQSTLGKLYILLYAFKMFIYALFMERFLLKQYLKLFRIRNKIIKI